MTEDTPFVDDGQITKEDKDISMKRKNMVCHMVILTRPCVRWRTVPEQKPLR